MGVMLIKYFESCYLTVYKDPGSDDGRPYTGGWGTVSDNGKPLILGSTRTQAEWDKLFYDQLLRDYLPACRKGLPNFDSMSAAMQGAWLSRVYNTGSDIFHNTSGNYTNTSKTIKRGNQGEIAEAMLFINRGGNGKRLKGLFRRRWAENRLAEQAGSFSKSDIKIQIAKWVAEADSAWPTWLNTNGN